MRTHRNARTTWHGRLLMVWRVLRQGWSVSATAAAAGISRTTAYKWLGRYEAEGTEGLEDRSSAPGRVWNRTPTKRERRIERLRRKRLLGRLIAAKVQMALSTVGGILRRLGLGSLKALEPRKEVVRA